jgi:hypothetical protein
MPEEARMFFSEEKNQKTFESCAGWNIRDVAGLPGEAVAAVRINPLART